MTTKVTRRTITRKSAIAELQAQELDVLVIGGGIVGAGVARDAALRGLRIGLVEQADFASGTSSRSSRLLHGGIRYLAQGRVALVREASKEKTVLGRIASHLAQPLPFVFPTRRGTTWSYWKLSAGVKLYDLLCGLKNFGRSSYLSVAATAALLPGLSTQQLTGSVRYFDALTNDARLVIDTLRSAALNGALLTNHVRFVDSVNAAGVWRCQLHDQITGKQFQLHTKTLVNATGPWSDRIPHAETHLRLTKGVHLVVDRERLPVPEAVVMTQGNRVLFAIPWGERVILGTTDTDYAGDLSNPPCEAADIAEVLLVVNETFPDVRLTGDDVISTWSGLRPLVADPHGKPSDISRRHNITMSHPGWWDVTGGKLTTYRLMAEETVDQLVRFLRRQAPVCQTAILPLIEQSEATPISEVLPPRVSLESVVTACQKEWALNLDDVMIRRTSWRYYHRDHPAIAEQVADRMAVELQWNDGEKMAQLERYRDMCL